MYHIVELSTMIAAIRGGMMFSLLLTKGKNQDYTNGVMQWK